MLEWKTRYPDGILNENFEILDSEKDVLDYILEQQGVTDIEAFEHPTKKNCHDPFLLKNMEQALSCLSHFLINNRDKEQEILLRVDPDVDGFTSAALISQFIKAIYPRQKIRPVFNYDKVHGLQNFDIANLKDIGLIIIPDASLEKDTYDKIDELKIPVIILDHHIIEDTEMEKHAIIISCTDGQYPSSNLTGVAVTYKFCVAYCKENGWSEEIPDDYLDLVSLGLIADSADARDLEVRYYMLRGMEEDRCINPLINELVKNKKAEGSMHLGRTITTMGWFISSMINGAIRYGKPEEQLLIFRALCGEQEEIPYQPRRKNASDPKPDIVIHTLAEEGARVCKNIKNRQDREVRGYMDALEVKIETEQLNKNKVLFVDGSDILQKKTVTGLVANKLATEYMRPCVVLKDYLPDLFGGSGRVYESGVDDFRQFLLDTGVFNDCKGHPGAFGIELKKENLPEAIRICNETLPDSALNTVFAVDFQISANNLSLKDVTGIANKHMYFGNGVESPTFAITDIELPAKKIEVLPDRSIHFVYRKIHYIVKFPKGATFNNLTLADRTILGTNTKLLKINLIGHFTLETINDVETPVIKFKDNQFDSQEVEGTEVVQRTVSTVLQHEMKKMQDDYNYDDLLNWDKKAVVAEEDWDTEVRNTANRQRMIDIDDDFIF